MQLAIVNVEAQTTDNIDGVDDGINKGDNNSSKQENLAHHRLVDDKAMDFLGDKVFVFHSRNNVRTVCWMIRLGIF